MLTTPSPCPFIISIGHRTANAIVLAGQVEYAEPDFQRFAFQQAIADCDVSEPELLAETKHWNIVCVLALHTRRVVATTRLAMAKAGFFMQDEV